MGGSKETKRHYKDTGKKPEQTSTEERSQQQSMGAEVLRVQMQLERAQSNKREFQEEQIRRGRVRDATYEARYQSWVRSKIEGMDKEIEKFTRQLEQMQRTTVTDVPQPAPYNPQAFSSGEGYSFGAVSGGGVERMGTIGRSQQYDFGYYGPAYGAKYGNEAEPVAGTQDPTQRGSFVEAALREEQERLAQEGMQQLAEENPDWLAEQGMLVDDLRARRQREPGQRRRRQPEQYDSDE